MPSEKLGDAILELKTDSKRFDKGIKKAEKRTDKLETKLKKAGLAAKALKSKLIAIGAALVVGVALTKAIQKVTKLGDEIAKMSKKTGIATETLSSFRLVMDLGGTSIQSFAKGMKTISKMMFDIRGGAGAEAEKAFKAIRVETENVDGSLRDVLDVFFDVADAFKDMKDGAEKAAVAQTILGRAGLELIPTLNMGSEEIRKQVQLAKDLGLQFSKLEGEQMEAFNDAVTVLTTSLFALWQNIVITGTPALTTLANKFTNVILAMKKFDTRLLTFNPLANAAGAAILKMAKSTTELAKAQKKLREAEGFFKFTQAEPKGLAMPAGFNNLKTSAKEAEGFFFNIEEKGKETFAVLENAVSGWASNFSSTLTDVLTGAELSFKSILKSFVDMLLQMVIQMTIVEPLLSGFFNILKGPSNAPVGGITGPPAPKKGLLGLGFLGLDKGGIVPGPIGAPVPAVVHGGEDVVPPGEQSSRGGGVVQTINISPGLPETVRAEIARFMPQIRQAAVDAVQSQRRRGGDMALAMGSRV